MEFLLGPGDSWREHRKYSGAEESTRGSGEVGGGCGDNDGDSAVTKAWCSLAKASVRSQEFPVCTPTSVLLPGPWSRWIRGGRLSSHLLPLAGSRPP